MQLLWEYIRSEVDNEISEGKVNEAEALRRVCKEKWKMDEKHFDRFLYYRFYRMRQTRVGRPAYLFMKRKFFHKPDSQGLLF